MERGDFGFFVFTTKQKDADATPVASKPTEWRASATALWPGTWRGLPCSTELKLSFRLLWLAQGTLLCVYIRTPSIKKAAPALDFFL